MRSVLAYDSIGGDPNRQNSTGVYNGENFDYPLANLHDYSTYTVCRWGGPGDPENWLTMVFSGQETIDYIGFMRHNLAVGTTIEVRTNADVLHETLTVTHTGPLLLELVTPYVSDGLKLEFVGPGGPGTIGQVSCAVLMYGAKLELPEGQPAPYVPPPLGRDSTVYPATSGSGNYLQGALQRTGWQFKITQRNVDPAWINTNWPAMVLHVERYPFFFSWDHDARPQDTMYAWAARKPTPPSYSNPLYMNWGLTCRGLHGD